MTTRHGETIRRRLESLGRRQLANGLLALVLLAVGLAAAGVVLVTLAFWSGWLLFVGLVPLGWLAVRWLRGLNTVSQARDVEAHFPAVEGRLVSALELAGLVPAGREGYSDELLEAAVADVEERFRPLPVERLVRRKRAYGAALAAAAGLALLAGLFVLAPARARFGLVNAFAPGRLEVEFAVVPGDTSVLPGSEFAIACTVRAPVRLGRVRLERAGAGAGSRVLVLEDGVVLVPVRATGDFSYRFRVLGARSAEHRVRVLEPVRVERLGLTIRYPAYSGLPDFRTASPDVAALRGSRVTVGGESNRPLAGARVVFAADTNALEVSGERGFAGEFTVRGDAEGRLELADAAGGGFQPVERLRVRAVPDESPLVKLLLPGRDVDLPVSMKLGLAINSLDDFGLTGLWLHWGRDSVFERRRIGSPSGREDTTFFAWDLSDVGLLPGEVASYYVSVSDNDNVSGPKTGRTPVFRVRFPTMTEIYESSVRQTERTASELAPMRDTQEELSQELGRIADQLRSEGELSWDQRQALGELLGEQQDLAEEIAELRDEVARLTDELFSGVALDRETMARLGQLQELLSRLLPRELQESLERLQQSLAEESPELQRALEQFEQDQEQLRESIDQALEFLERVMEEQRLEALARQAEDLARAEQEVARQAPAGDLDDLVEAQAGVEAGLDSLLRELQDLAASMSDSATADSLAGLAEAAEQDGFKEQAGQVTAQLQQGQRSQAGSEAGKLGDKLKQMAESLQAMSQGLKKKRSGEAARELAAAAEELLMVSREQEGLEQQAARGGGVDGLAARAMSLANATTLVAESLAALGGRTMAVPAQAVAELFRANNTMKAAAQTMVENRAGPAARQLRNARTAVDRATAMVLAALEQAASGGGMSGSMSSLMEQLGQMTADQMAINMGMSGMPIPMPGGMSGSQAEALSRLLSQQAALRERLEQLLEEMGGERPGLTGSLEGLVDEMKEVERALAELDIDRELVERQESILSHLLDAQRSVRQQGHKEQRESETARPFERGPRVALPEDHGERNRLLREELMRALKTGELGDYEPMIRAYFEKLLSEP